MIRALCKNRSADVWKLGMPWGPVCPDYGRQCPCSGSPITQICLDFTTPSGCHQGTRDQISELRTTMRSESIVSVGRTRPDTGPIWSKTLILLRSLAFAVFNAGQHRHRPLDDGAHEFLEDTSFIHKVFPHSTIYETAVCQKQPNLRPCSVSS